MSEGKRICFICNTPMENKIISIKSSWGDYEIIIKGVKAYVCPNCGEKVFSPDDTEMIQEITEKLSEIKTKSIKKGDILNLTDVADLLSVSNQTVYNMIKDGRLKAYKIGREWRFIRKDIEGLLEPENIDIAARNQNGQLSEYEKILIKKYSQKNVL